MSRTIPTEIRTLLKSRSMIGHSAPGCKVIFSDKIGGTTNSIQATSVHVNREESCDAQRATITIENVNPTDPSDPGYYSPYRSTEFGKMSNEWVSELIPSKNLWIEAGYGDGVTGTLYQTIFTGVIDEVTVSRSARDSTLVVEARDMAWKLLDKQVTTLYGQVNPNIKEEFHNTATGSTFTLSNQNVVVDSIVIRSQSGGTGTVWVNGGDYTINYSTGVVTHNGFMVPSVYCDYTFIPSANTIVDESHSATGASFSLTHSNIVPGTISIWSASGETGVHWVEGGDYTLNYATGVVTHGGLTPTSYSSYTFVNATEIDEVQSAYQGKIYLNNDLILPGSLVIRSKSGGTGTLYHEGATLDYTVNYEAGEVVGYGFADAVYCTYNNTLCDFYLEYPLPTGVLQGNGWLVPGATLDPDGYNANDASAIVKDLCCRAGFQAADITIQYSEINDIDPIFERLTFMDAISQLVTATGFEFIIDEYGMVRFRQISDNQPCVTKELNVTEEIGSTFTLKVAPGPDPVTVGRLVSGSLNMYIPATGTGGVSTSTSIWYKDYRSTETAVTDELHSTLISGTFNLAHTNIVPASIVIRSNSGGTGTLWVEGPSGDYTLNYQTGVVTSGGLTPNAYCSYDHSLLYAVGLDGDYFVNLATNTNNVYNRQTGSWGSPIGTYLVEDTDYSVDLDTSVVTVLSAQMENLDYLPTAYVYAAYTFQEGYDIFNLSLTISLKNMYGRIRVAGDAADYRYQVGPTLWDGAQVANDKILFIDEAYLDTDEKARKCAQRVGLDAQRRYITTQFAAIPVPWLQIGDCIQVIESASTISEIYRITSLDFNYDSSGGIMQIKAYHVGYATG